ncbi:MAG: M48 family metalloprotease [Pseudomonadota bacterium]
MAILMAFTTPSFTEGLPDLGDTSEAALPPRQEAALGQQIMREIRADRSYVDDPQLAAYLQNLGSRLVQAGQRSTQEFEFFLVEDASLNAFALPGGFIGVNTGLILAAQNESELSAVLSHEIAHVTQRHIARLIAGQRGAMLTSLAGLAIAILAARSNSQVSEAALASTQASMIQNQLNFTREHEQEADRVGLQTLSAGGFDPRAMATFFERLQRSTRPLESNAPSYLRTHPLTIERIADIENRLDKLPTRQVASSLDFLLVKAKIRATTGSPQEALRYFEPNSTQTGHARTALIYGTATALRRAHDFTRAEKEANQLIGSKPQHPMIESLLADIKRDEGQNSAALERYRSGLKLFPKDRALFYGQVETLLALKNYSEALKTVNDRLLNGQDEEKLYELQSKTYAALGKRLLQHQAQAEVYYRRGDLRAAEDQLQIAIKSGDGDFYQVSSAEARLRQIRTEIEPQKPGSATTRDRP